MKKLKKLKDEFTRLDTNRKIKAKKGKVKSNLKFEKRKRKTTIQYLNEEE